MNGAKGQYALEADGYCHWLHRSQFSGALFSEPSDVANTGLCSLPCVFFVVCAVALMNTVAVVLADHLVH